MPGSPSPPIGTPPLGRFRRKINSVSGALAGSRFNADPQRERAMLRFRRMKTLQKFTSVHANVQNHFNTERHLIDRPTYKMLRSAALAEWRGLVA